MNIKEAKEEIKNAMTAYFSKNEFGEYEIPLMRQRPIFLMGPPGVGKTAIMEQVAQELNVGIISYSMTHHTRQSALGLPFIETKSYGGKEYSVSEYTMSEIIASVYDMMEETGVEEGILFLDEINCVSETLAPSMLQFLQYKIFGRHQVPDGWIVVTAGNPPEYNNSVREFDIVTWDRLKRIDVIPDYEVWKEYALRSGTHPAITTYLDIKKGDFYKIETTVDGKSFVTARGWSDLSDMIKLYEKNHIKVTEKLIAQYIQNYQISKDFSVYYDLFNKYRSDYQVDTILSGKCTSTIKERAKNAKFDERISLLGLILDAITVRLKEIYNEENTVVQLLLVLKEIRAELASETKDVIDVLTGKIEIKREELNKGRKAGSLSSDDQYICNKIIKILEEYKRIIEFEKIDNASDSFKRMKDDYSKRTEALKQHTEIIRNELGNMFKFCEEVFGEGQEMVILVTELTVNFYSSHFISKYGCDEYLAHNKELLFYERQKEIIMELDRLDLEDDIDDEEGDE